MSPPRVLVTGGAGFIGSHLVDWLVGRGHPVTVLDNFASGRAENLAEARSAPGFQLIEGSILDPAALSTAIEGCELVYHLAVECVRRSLGRPLDNHDVNATGTIHVLEAARRAAVRRFVYCSSSEVYGNTSSGRLREDATLPKPVTVYGAAKLVGEYYALAYRQTYGLDAVVVRPFNAYGPREHHEGDLAEVIPRFFIQVMNGRPPVIFGDGSQGRDFTHVTDVARGIGMAGTRDELGGQIINIACGRMITIREVARAALGLAGLDLDPIFIEPRPGDVLALEADTIKASKLLGYESSVAFEAGLASYFDWFGRELAGVDLVALLEADPRNWTMPVQDGRA